MSFGLFGVHDFDIKGSLYDGSTSDANNKLANRQYVLDAVAAGGGEWFSSVLAQQDAPPSTPSTGDRYLVGASGSGAWSSLSNNIVEWDGSAWDTTAPDVGAPTAGAHVYIEGGSSNAGNTMIYRTSPSTGWVVAASASGALLKTQNLSDLDNVSTARSNLGLGDLATQNNVDLASDVTGQLPLANGGTGASDASGARSNLGLGSIATQASDSVSITGGSITGITDLAVADGGTGASDAAGARSNLGAQAQNDLLDDISGLTIADGTFLVGDANGDIVAESGATARASLGLGSAAVLDEGESAGDVVKLDAALDVNEVLGRTQLDQLVLSSNTNFNYLYTGGSFSVTGTYGNVSGTILELDSSTSSWIISITSGYSSYIQSGDSASASGYSFTVSSVGSVTRNQGLDGTQIKSIIGNAQAGSSSGSPTKGVASFNNEDFTVSSGFVSLISGLDSGDAAKLIADVSADHLLKSVSWSAVSSGYLISSNAIDTSARTVKTQTNVSSIVAGQYFESSGYSFEIQSIQSDGASTPTYTITVADPSSNLQYLYNGGSFSIAGGDGFVSAGAYGTAANVDVANGVGSSAQGKVLVVSSGASLTANSLLAIDSSGNIIAGSAGEQGTVTSIALADDDGDDTTAVTTSGAIVVKGGGSNSAITTNVNGSGELEVIAADASTTQAGVMAFASSSNYSSGSHVAGVAFTTGADLGADKFITLNSSAQIETFVPTHYGIDGPIVKSCTGIATSITMPSTVGALEGAYVVNDSSASADVSVSLPTSVTSADIGATVTFKVQELNGQKLRISGGTVSGGARMLIDGANHIDLDQPRQSVTLHLGAVLGSASQSVDALCWSIL